MHKAEEETERVMIITDHNNDKQISIEEALEKYESLIKSPAMQYEVGARKTKRVRDELWTHVAFLYYPSFQVYVMLLP